MSPRSSARERIIDATELVVLKEGASHMTMEDVAAKAGVSKGGLICAHVFRSIENPPEMSEELFSHAYVSWLVAETVDARGIFARV